MKALWIASAFAVMLSITIPAAAHHSMAGFDRTQNKSLTGTVVEFKWANPHSWIELAVPQDNGKTVHWNVEMTAPGYLARAGWKRTTVSAGDKVTVVVNPLITGEPGGLFVSIQLPDGKVLTQRGELGAKGKGKAK